MFCFFCKKEIALDDKIGRQARCPHCSGDLHICKNCDYYDAASYNECRETQADRVVDKDRSNFCDYFAPRRGAIDRAQNDGNDAKKKLEELFKRKRE